MHHLPHEPTVNTIFNVEPSGGDLESKMIKLCKS